MAKVLAEIDVCECCALIIANNDNSACRDYYGHTHSDPQLSERLTRQLAETYGVEVGASNVVLSHYDNQTDGFCAMCDQDGYTTVGTAYVIG